MKEELKVIVLIPALNPNEDLIKLVDELKVNNFDVIVINDGSTSKYVFIYNSINAIVLTHKENLGKGSAIKTGLEYIKDNYKGDYIVITMDADGQHTVRDAKKILEYSRNHMDSLVIGSRVLDKKTPLRSRFGNMLTRNIFRLSTGVKIYDTQSGLRSFSNKLINKVLSISGNRYEYEINVLLECAKDRIPIKEIRIKTIYIDNNSSSHFNALTDSFKIYKEIIKFSFSSIISFIIDFLLYGVFIVVLKDNKYSLVLSNIFARVISASFNYNFNKNIVFNHNGSIKKSLSLYVLLASIILVLNTLLLTMFVNIGLSKIVSKIVTEMVLFILSFIVQNKFIFKEKNNGE